jgi:TolB-like protein/Tfp pilus assembly protein PilF
MTETSRAVFLSYASEDVEAARRICEALRAGGIEVWFDQSELRGGDAWNRQIRDQIRDCALFVPIISAHSQARLEGYFRREWKLAADRTHDMAEEKPFLVPVVIDYTSERGAAVPEKFKEVHWTHLLEGETSPAFVDQVTRLLSSAQQKPSADPAPAPRQPVPRTVASRRMRNVSLLVAAVAALGGSYFALDKFVLSKHSADPGPAPALAVAARAVPQSAIPEKSIAVLPFVDMSEKRNQEYFSDGLSEELIDLLAKVPDLRVSARTSSFYFKGKSEDIPTIAQKLRVAHVLEGSVRQAAHTVRVTAQLIRADNGYHLWSETYDRDLKDIFKVQDEIAGAVVAALKLKLEPGQQILSSPRTSIPEAYNQYLLGRQFYDRGNLDGYRRSIDAFRKSIQLDPSYASAYAELAMSEFNAAAYAVDAAAYAAGVERALAAANGAIALAPNEADGYAARGYMRPLVRWDWTGAQADVEKALALAPGDDRVQRRYATVMMLLDRRSEATVAATRATELDPLSSTAWLILGQVLTASRQFKAADVALHRALEIQPESEGALVDLACLRLFEGNAAEALPVFRKYEVLWGIAMAEYTLGHAQESQQALDELIAKEAQGWAYAIASIYAWRSEKDKAFEWLDRAYKQPASGLANIKSDVPFAPLRADPRFNALLQKMKMPE